MLPQINDFLTSDIQSCNAWPHKKFRKNTHSVPMVEDSYFYSEYQGAYLINRSERKLLSSDTLEEIEGLLNSGTFFRLNQKYMTRIDSIYQVISKGQGRLNVKIKGCDDDEIIVSRENSGSFKHCLDR